MNEREFLKWNVLEWHNPRVFNGVHVLRIVNTCYLQKGSVVRYFEPVGLKSSSHLLLQNFSEFPQMGYRMLCFLTKKPYTVEHLLEFKFHGTYRGKCCLGATIRFLRISVVTHVKMSHLLPISVHSNKLLSRKKKKINLYKRLNK